MILLEAGNRVLQDTILQQFQYQPHSKPRDNEESKDNESTSTPQRDPILIHLCDFDDTHYKLSLDPTSTQYLILSMSFPAYKSIKSFGAEESLKQHYSTHFQDTAVENGYDVTLHIPLNDENTVKQYITNKYADELSKIKNYAIAGVFERYFVALKEQKSAALPPLQYNLHHDTTIYIVPKHDRITVVYELNFHDKVDRAIAKNFLNEFIESKRRIGAAPPCTYSYNTLLELQQAFQMKDKPSEKLGYLSFSVLPNHLSDHPKIKQLSIVLSLFRTYIQYHIKSSKTYFHMRMRQRVNSMLQVLNRAKQESDENLAAGGGSKKGMKTITGKTFTRQ